MTKLEDNYWKRLCDKEQELQKLQQENKQLKEKIYELRTRIDKTLQALKEILFYDEFSDTTNGFGNVKRELMFYLSECKTLEEFDEILGDKENE